VERELGRGGMAFVFLAHDVRHDRQVAIKVLRPELASALGDERFLREIKLTARLTHPRIVSIYDSGVADDLLYYVMPFVRGESLRERLQREGQLPIADAIEITTAVAAALTYAHAHGVIHRDIKPENILFADGELLVADFGIGRSIAATGEGRLTETGLSLGTPAYMSPEQSFSEQTIDGRADVFSLGCVLYEMLVGEPPFRGLTAQAVAARRAMDPMPPIRGVRSTVPIAVEEAIRKSLEKLPVDRFASAGAFSAALTKASTGTTVAPRRAMSIRGRRLWFAMTALLLVAVVGGGAYARHKLLEPNRSGIAVLGFDNNSANRDDDYIGAGLADELTNMLVKVKAPNWRVLPLRSQRRGVAVSDSVGRASSARTLLRGSFQRIGKGIRVTVLLINAEDGVTLATDQYTQDSLDVFALRDTVANAVVDRLDVAMGATTRATWSKRSTRSPEALAAYSQGRLLVTTRRSQQDIVKAGEYFAHAIELDSSYAQAWSGLADVYSFRSFFGLLDPREGVPIARRYVRHALALDNTLPEAHTSAATIHLIYEEDEAAGLREIQQALRINPDYAEAHLFYAWYHLSTGRLQDAIREATTARDLDPLSLMINARLGWMLIQAGPSHFAAADTALRLTLKLDPTNSLAYTELAQMYAMDRPRRCPDALRVADSIPQSPHFGNQGAKAYVYAVCGQKDKARRLIAESKAALSDGFVFGIAIALPYLALGETDSAFAWLSRAVDQRAPGVNANPAGFDPTYGPFQSDPRWPALLKRRHEESRCPTDPDACDRGDATVTKGINGKPTRTN
jgi:TolB-like protein/tetratricopeptide (TPR) repeat protein